MGLVNEKVTIADQDFWFSPHVTNLPRWAFNQSNTDDFDYWMRAPYVDVIVSHGPPFGVCDVVSSAGHVGSEGLTRAIKRIKPKLVICGHIHEGFGVHSIGDTLVYNVAHVNERYEPVNTPVVIEL